MCDQAEIGTKDKEVRQTERCQEQAAGPGLKEAQHVAAHSSRFEDATNQRLAERLGCYWRFRSNIASEDNDYTRVFFGKILCMKHVAYIYFMGETRCAHFLPF